MNPERTDVALLVHSCDRYEFLYQGFHYFFARHWDFAVNCRYYFATEEKEPTVPGFQVVKSGKGAWADRLATLLREHVTAEYVLYFQEDMWLDQPVDARFFAELFALAKKHNWQQVKLHSSDVYQTVPTAEAIEGFVVAQLDNARSNFLMSHQVTLWNRQFLLAQLKRNEHPWRNERKGTERLRKLNVPIFQLDYFAENGSEPLNQNHNTTPRSGYYTVSVNGMLNYTVEPYVHALAAGDAAAQDYARRLQYNYDNQLTHDGAAPPRKVDVFKRLSNWFRRLAG